MQLFPNNIMFCKNCGNKLKDNTKFCTSCGREVVISNNNISKPESEVLVLKNSLQLKNIFIKIKKNINKPLIFTVLGIIFIVIITIFLILHYNNKKITGILKLKNNTQSVVDIWCDNGQGGSGTIFSVDGIVLTNNHVITGSKSCKVTIPDETTGGIEKIYEATPVITPKLSEKYDVATLKINGAYTDSDGKVWGIYPTTFSPYLLPETCNTNELSKLGDSVKIYGYPVTSGGYNLTITDGIISSFADDGNILTSAQIDSGNSGGLAIDQNGCWLGISSAVVSGNYQNLGVIIPGSIVEIFLDNVPVKLSPSAGNTNSVSESAVIPGETNDQQCQNYFGINSEWDGKTNSSGTPECLCQNSYSWNATGNSCDLQTSLEKECKDRFGKGSYSYTEEGKAVCGCKKGYQLNSKETLCISSTTIPATDTILDTNVPGCTSNMGYSATTGLSCSGNGSCADGSFKYDGKNECMTPSSYCQSQNGLNTVYNLVDNSCGCATGYVLDKNNKCVTPYQICSDQFLNETWDGTLSADGKYNCVCQTGHTWNTYTESCY